MDKTKVPEILTVTQNFINDSFANADDMSLKELKLRDGGILVEKGRNIYLALIHRGNLTREQHKRIAETIRNIESHYQDEIMAWDGGSDGFKEIDKRLQSLIIS